MFTPDNFNALANHSSDLCISIYVPTYRSGNTNEDRIRLKNALQEVSKELERRDKTKSEIHQLIGRAESMLDDETLLRSMSDGLAMFIAKDFFEYYLVPIDVNQQVIFGTNFMVRPLMNVLNSDSRFFILALSQNEVRFFEGTEHSITPVIIDDLVPENLAEAQYNDESQNNLQFHSGSGDNNTPIYHGQGGGEDDYNENREDFFRQVDKGLMKMLFDEKAPLIIASIDEQAAMYRKISDYQYITTENISGNVENNDPVLLHEKAWAIMQPHFKKSTQENKENFNAKLSDNKASFAVTDIIPAAINGRVETLYINKDHDLYGQYDEATNNVIIHKEQQKDSVDLLDLAARKTYESGGAVFNLEMEKLPRMTSSMNAIYRYSY